MFKDLFIKRSRENAATERCGGRRCAATGGKRASGGSDAAASANGACGGGRAYCLSPDGCGASGGLCGGVRDEPEMCYDSAMNFVYPAYLLILWLLPVIGIVLWWKRHRYRSAARLFRGGTAPGRPERRFVAQSLLCLAGAGLLVVAAARPQ